MHETRARGMLLRNMRLAPLTHASARPPTVFIPATPPTARLPSLRFAASFGSAACRAASTATPAAVAMPPITRVDGPWEGLQAYRAAPRDLRWTWGKRGPEARVREGEPAAAQLMMPSLAEWGREVLLTADPLQKISKTHAAFAAFVAGELPVGVAEAPPSPARPALPRLVQVHEVPRFDNSPLPVNAHMLHNLAHVELNAIDLAWDTVVRYSHLYPTMPLEFYADFARVADDESRHLGWCLQRLAELGHAYGDMDAHNLLWEGAQATSDDVTARLALVPCVQEARGLDAGPRLSEKLRGHQDPRSADIVDRISAEEMAHVAVGVAWFAGVCQQLGRSPETTFQRYVAELCPGGILKGPFNVESREAAGLQHSWYASVADVPPPVGGVPKRRRGQTKKQAAEEAERAAAAGDDVRLERMQLERCNLRDLQRLEGRLASVLVMEAAVAEGEEGGGGEVERAEPPTPASAHPALG